MRTQTSRTFEHRVPAVVHPEVPCGSPYCCPGVYTVRNPRKRKGAQAMVYDEEWDQRVAGRGHRRGSATTCGRWLPGSTG